MILTLTSFWALWVSFPMWKSGIIGCNYTYALAFHQRWNDPGPFQTSGGSLCKAAKHPRCLITSPIPLPLSDSIILSRSEIKELTFFSDLRRDVGVVDIWDLFEFPSFPPWWQYTISFWIIKPLHEWSWWRCCFWFLISTAETERSRLFLSPSPGPYTWPICHFVGKWGSLNPVHVVLEGAVGIIHSSWRCSDSPCAGTMTVQSASQSSAMPVHSIHFQASCQFCKPSDIFLISSLYVKPSRAGFSLRILIMFFMIGGGHLITP